MLTAQRHWTTRYWRMWDAPTVSANRQARHAEVTDTAHKRGAFGWTCFPEPPWSPSRASWSTVKRPRRPREQRKGEGGSCPRMQFPGVDAGAHGKIAAATSLNWWVSWTLGGVLVVRDLRARQSLFPCSLVFLSLWRTLSQMSGRDGFKGRKLTQ